MEEHARRVLEDSVLCERAKRIRHDLAETVSTFDPEGLLSARDIDGDAGTEVRTETEQSRRDTTDVARAAAKRLTESLRCIEEYGKLVSPDASRRVERLRYEAYALEQAVFIGGPRRAKLRRARLHVLITEALCEGPWLAVCRKALRGGAEVLQLREKELSDVEWLTRARRLRTLTREAGALLIINDRPDIALLSEADGVHLGHRDLSIADARRIVGIHMLIGRSTHSKRETEAALDESPDYIAVGPMFVSDTKPDAEVRGPELLREVAALTADRTDPALPLVAIGGITPENAADVLKAAEARTPVQLAVCQGIIARLDPETAARSLKACYSGRTPGSVVGEP